MDMKHVFIAETWTGILSPHPARKYICFGTSAGTHINVSLSLKNLTFFLTLGLCVGREMHDLEIETKNGLRNLHAFYSFKLHLTMNA